MALYFERYYDGREASFRKAFLERANAPDGVVATSADGDLRKSTTTTRSRSGRRAPRSLTASCASRVRRSGNCPLYRPRDAPAFSPRERNDLASIMKYVAHGGRDRNAPRPTARATSRFQDSDDEAMLVIDRGGNVRHGSEKARRLLLLATTSEINPASLKAAVNDRPMQVLKTLCARLEASRAPRIRPRP